MGRHLMVGYGTIEEIEPLVTKAAVSGVFVSRRNASNKDFEGLAWEIRILQDLRARNGLPPLWIAGDQEGGIVSSLSPPLTRPRALRSLLADAATFQQENTRKAQELSCLGINVNLAPVVDLNRGIRDPSDRYSRIADRSISADPEIVSDASATYCSILAKHGVRCTLKHFPGLGRLAADTHVGSAVLPDLEQSDLAPFRNLTNSLDPHPWVMLSHVTVASLDPRRPASGSAPVIDILRRDWQFEGVLVTDDAHMAAYQGNLESNLVGSLSGGVDLVLVAYDPDLTYTVLAMLLRAYRTGQLGRKTLLESDRRLERHRAAAHIGCTTAAD